MEEEESGGNISSAMFMYCTCMHTLHGVVTGFFSHYCTLETGGTCIIHVYIHVNYSSHRNVVSEMQKQGHSPTCI